jgi:hypothetical protein
VQDVRDSRSGSAEAAVAAYVRRVIAMAMATVTTAVKNMIQNMLDSDASDVPTYQLG